MDDPECRYVSKEEAESLRADGWAISELRGTHRDAYAIATKSGIGTVKVTMQDIVRVVAKSYGVSPHDIVSTSRAEQFVRPRHMCMWFARKARRVSYPFIASCLSRHHTTVKHGVERVEAERKTSRFVAERIEEIHKALREAEVGK